MIGFLSLALGPKLWPFLDIVDLATLIYFTVTLKLEYCMLYGGLFQTTHRTAILTDQHYQIVFGINSRI